MKNKIIAIIGAMDIEIDYILKNLKNTETILRNNFKIYRGKIGNSDIILSKSGVGKVNMAITAQYIIDNFSPDYIINTGVAGGVGDNLQVGDIVVGEKLVQHDFDATAVGYAKGNICDRSNRNNPTAFYSDEKLTEKIFNLSKEILKKNKIHKGLIATGDMFVANYNKKIEIKNSFDALAIEMEGASLAQTASKNNIPFVVIRAISDLADGSNIEFQDEFEKQMSSIVSRLIESLVEEI